MKELAKKELVKSIIKLVCAILVLLGLSVVTFYNFHLPHTQELTPTFVDNLLLWHWFIATLTLVDFLFIFNSIEDLKSSIDIYKLIKEIEKKTRDKRK